MANPNPNTEPLALGRGKRPKLENETVCMRMSPGTRQALEEIAYSYDCMYGGKPWIAGLLEKIGNGELLVVPAPPQRETVAQQPFNPRKAIKEHLAQKYHPATSKPPKETPPQR